MAQNLVLSNRAKLELQELKNTLGIKTDTKCIEFLILNYSDLINTRQQYQDKAHNYFQELQAVKKETKENLESFFYGLQRLEETKKKLQNGSKFFPDNEHLNKIKQVKRPKKQ